MFIIDGEPAMTLREAAKYLGIRYKDLFERFMRARDITQIFASDGRQYLKKSDVERLRERR